MADVGSVRWLMSGPLAGVRNAGGCPNPWTLNELAVVVEEPTVDCWLLLLASEFLLTPAYQPLTILLLPNGRPLSAIDC